MLVLLQILNAAQNILNQNSNYFSTFSMKPTLYKDKTRDGLHNQKDGLVQMDGPLQMDGVLNHQAAGTDRINILSCSHDKLYTLYFTFILQFYTIKKRYLHGELQSIVINKTFL